MAALTHVPVGALHLERFESVLPPEDYERMLRTVRRGREVFDGRVVWNVNSTARGGGVAEMLVSLLAYARGAGVDARWVVIDGDDRILRAHQAAPQPPPRLARRRRPARRRASARSTSAVTERNAARALRSRHARATS